MRQVSLPSSALRYGRFAACVLAALLAAGVLCPAQSAPDVLVLSNGDTLHGKLVNAIGGKVTFQSDAGDITLPWSKIRELRSSQTFAVLSSNSGLRTRKQQGAIPAGTLVMQNQMVTIRPTSPGVPPLAPIPVGQAQYVIAAQTLRKEATSRPGLLSGWGGAATAGATIVTATQSQYTFSGGIGLARVVPAVTWLARRNRTSLDFNGSFGKITEPAFVNAAGVLVPAVVTKTAIYHADAERDENLTPRLFALAAISFDHNFSQNLDLQQIFGGGLGWTVLKTPTQEANLKATIQYEKQLFISSGPGANQNLIGSTFSADYEAHLKMIDYAQTLAFIPAYNNPRAYSAAETDTLAFPAYKNLSFSLGSADSYLNDPPATLPPTKRNSFQFTMGLSFAIKPKY